MQIEIFDKYSFNCWLNFQSHPVAKIHTKKFLFFSLSKSIFFLLFQIIFIWTERVFCWKICLINIYINWLTIWFEMYSVFVCVSDLKSFSFLLRQFWIVRFVFNNFYRLIWIEEVRYVRKRNKIFFYDFSWNKRQYLI